MKIKIEKLIIYFILIVIVQSSCIGTFEEYALIQGAISTSECNGFQLEGSNEGIVDVWILVRDTHFNPVENVTIAVSLTTLHCDGTKTGNYFRELATGSSGILEDAVLMPYKWSKDRGELRANILNQEYDGLTSYELFSYDATNVSIVMTVSKLED